MIKLIGKHDKIKFYFHFLCGNFATFLMEENQFGALLEKFIDNYKSDGWELKSLNNSKYGYNARRMLSETLNDEIIFGNYYISWDPVFRVPVLSALFFKETGQRLTFDELMSLIPRSLDRTSISEREHEITGTPVFYIHPCKTAAFVQPFVDSGADYLNVWMVSYGPIFFYKLPF